MKREPKHRGEFKGLRKVFPPCCGMTCCGTIGKAAKKVIRSHRKKIRNMEIQEGLESINPKVRE